MERSDDVEMVTVTAGPNRWLGPALALIAVVMVGAVLLGLLSDDDIPEASPVVEREATAVESLVDGDASTGVHTLDATRAASEIWTREMGWTFFGLDEWQRLLDASCSEEFWSVEGANRVVQTYRLDRGVPSMRANFTLMTVLDEVCPADPSFDPAAAILDFGVTSYPEQVGIEVVPGDVVLTDVEEPDRSGYVMYRLRPGAIGDQAWPIAVVTRSGRQPSQDDLTLADRALPVISFEPQLPLRVLLPDSLTATAFSSKVELRFCPLTASASCVDVEATAGPGLSAMPAQAPPSRAPTDDDPGPIADDALRVWVAETGWTTVGAADWNRLVTAVCESGRSTDVLRHIVEDAPQTFRGTSVARSMHLLWVMSDAVCSGGLGGSEPPGRGDDPGEYRGFVEFEPGGAVIMPHGTTATGAAPAVSLYFRPHESETTDRMVELAVMTAASFSTDTARLPDVLPPGVYRLCPHHERMTCPEYRVDESSVPSDPTD